MNFNSTKNGQNKSFSCKTKSSKPCILMKRMCLYYPITKRVEIIMRIQVCPVERMNSDSKESRGTKSISFKTKHQNGVSYRGEHVNRAQSQKNEDYHEN